MGKFGISLFYWLFSSTSSATDFLYIHRKLI